MRRVLVSVTMLSLLVAGMTLRVVGSSAQQATPAAVSLPPWVEAWITALETEDPHGFADLYLNDGTHEDVAAGMSVHDRFSIVEVAAMSMASQDDFTITPIAFHQGEDWAVLESPLFSCALGTACRTAIGKRARWSLQIRMSIS